jgi:hypothetical protein
MTKRALKEPALTKYGSVPMMRRPSAEVAAEEDPAIREAKLLHKREAWKANRIGKRRLCLDITEELLAQIKTASELHEMSQQFLVNFILERELPKWGSDNGVWRNNRVPVAARQRKPRGVRALLCGPLVEHDACAVGSRTAADV